MSDVVLQSVRVGALTSLPPEGHATGMVKQPVDGPVRVTRLGLDGDRHGDPRVHGGAEKALHYFSLEGYEKFAAAVPVPVHAGDLGENFHGRGLTERDVCIGDVFRVGTALAQVSQPRSPCWKIDHRLDHVGANLTLAKLRCQGWYLRVLEEGVVQVGDRMVLEHRPSPGATLDLLLAVQQQMRPEAEVLTGLAAAEGLTDQLRRRLLGRAEWLSRQ